MMQHAQRMAAICLALVLLLGGSSAYAALVGVENETGDLHTIDPSTGATAFHVATTLPDSDPNSIYGACTSATLHSIWATSRSPSRLYSVVISTGAVTDVGAYTGATGSIYELAYDVAGGVLYGTDYVDLYSVDPATAVTTSIGNLSVQDFWAMTYVPGMGLYGVATNTEKLYQISTTDASLTEIGPTNQARIIDLAYDVDTSRLIASGNGPTRILNVDPSTGNATVLNSSGVPNMLGIAFVGNAAPAANAGPDQIVEANTAGGADVTLDGSGSSDADGDPLTYLWTWSDAGGNHSATGVNPTVFLLLGDTTVTLVVNDGLVDSSPDEVVISVVDTTPPEILDLEATPHVLWPPNRKMRRVTLSYTVFDAADPDPDVEITSITCNEPSFRARDYEIIDPEHLKLRAKRRGRNRAGRIYTLTLTATDDAGNAAESQCTVWVPHDMRGKRGRIKTAVAVPTAGGAQIVFSLTDGADVTARVLNIAGRPVRTLCTARPHDAGTNTLLWNATSDSGLPVPGGTYLVEVSASGADGTQSRALTTLRLDR